MAKGNVWVVLAVLLVVVTLLVERKLQLVAEAVAAALARLT